MGRHGHGVDPRELDDAALLRELEQAHRTRHDAVLHAPDAALEAHTRRMAELEDEYLARHPDRRIAPDRTRAGARARAEETGDQPAG